MSTLRTRSVISIRNSLTELEKCHQERDAVVDCYVGAIKNLAHYTIELDHRRLPNRSAST